VPPGGVQDVVAGGEVPDGEAFGEFDDGFGHAGGDVAEADGAEVHSDPSSALAVAAGGVERIDEPGLLGEWDEAFAGAHEEVGDQRLGERLRGVLSQLVHL
jgi:hypothetical protein